MNHFPNTALKTWQRIVCGLPYLCSLPDEYSIKKITGIKKSA